MIPQEFVDSLLAQTDIAAVIGQYVPLRRRGGELVGLCPFHGDKSPSMSVSTAKGVFLCRSCAASGNAIGFLMEHTGMSFPEVIEKLALAANMEVPKTGRSAHPLSSDSLAIMQALDRAADLYQRELAGSAVARDYLKSRGVDPKSAEKFRLGFAPRSSDLILKGLSDVPHDVLVRAGLVTPAEEGKPSRDWMFNRIMFPIRNTQGRVIGFGGRTLDENPKTPKYINSPDTPVFKKGRELYGLFEAAPEIRKKNQAFVFEGYLDVVASSANGVDNAVCLMGTALSQFSVQRLFRMADQAIICLDSDRAGRNAAIRSMDTMLPEISAAKSAGFMFLPDGQDPDDFVRAQGSKAFYEASRKAEPLSKFLLRTSQTGIDLGTAEGKAKFATVAMERINKIDSAVMRSAIVEELRGIVGQGVKLTDTGPAPLQARKSSDPVNLGRRILTNAMKDPRILAEFDTDFLRVATAQPEEIETICEIARIVREIPEEHRVPAVIMDRFKGTPYERILTEACTTDEARTEGDPAQQMADITIALGQRWVRMSRLDALRQALAAAETGDASVKPPAPQPSVA